MKTRKPKTYTSINAMIRGTSGSRKQADALIDRGTELLVKQNLALLEALTDLVKDCSCDSYSTVCCPDKRVRNRAWRVAKKHGAVLPGVPRLKPSLKPYDLRRP